MDTNINKKQNKMKKREKKIEKKLDKQLEKRNLNTTETELSSHLIHIFQKHL